MIWDCIKGAFHPLRMLSTRKNCLSWSNAAVFCLYIFVIFIKSSNTAFVNNTTDTSSNTTSGLIKLSRETEVKGNQSSSPTERLIVATNMTAARLKEQAEGPDADWKQNTDGKWEWKGKPRDKSKQPERSVHRNLLKPTQSPSIVNGSATLPSLAQHQQNTTNNNTTDKINIVATSASIKQNPAVTSNESSVSSSGNKSAPISIALHQNESVLTKTNVTNDQQSVSPITLPPASDIRSNSSMKSHSNVTTENKTLSTSNVSLSHHILKAAIGAPDNASFPMPVVHVNVSNVELSTAGNYSSSVLITANDSQHNVIPLNISALSAVSANTDGRFIPDRALLSNGIRSEITARPLIIKKPTSASVIENSSTKIPETVRQAEVNARPLLIKQLASATPLLTADNLSIDNLPVFNISGKASAPKLLFEMHKIAEHLINQTAGHNGSSIISNEIQIDIDPAHKVSITTNHTYGNVSSIDSVPFANNTDNSMSKIHPGIISMVLNSTGSKDSVGAALEQNIPALNIQEYKDAHSIITTLGSSLTNASALADLADKNGRKLKVAKIFPNNRTIVVRVENPVVRVETSDTTTPAKPIPTSTESATPEPAEPEVMSMKVPGGNMQSQSEGLAGALARSATDILASGQYVAPQSLRRKTTSELYGPKSANDPSFSQGRRKGSKKNKSGSNAKAEQAGNQAFSFDVRPLWEILSGMVSSIGGDPIGDASGAISKVSSMLPNFNVGSLQTAIQNSKNQSPRLGHGLAG